MSAGDGRIRKVVLGQPSITLIRSEKTFRINYTCTSNTPSDDFIPLSFTPTKKFICTLSIRNVFQLELSFSQNCKSTTVEVGLSRIEY